MIQDVIELKLVTPNKSIFLKVDWIEVEAPNGGFIVGPGHESLISIVKQKSRFSYKTNQGDFVIMETLGGLFTVSQNKAVALLDEEQKR